MNLKSSFLYGIVLVSLLSSSSLFCASHAMTGTSFFSPRSANFDLARTVINWRRYIIPYDDTLLHSCLGFMPVYERSFRPHDLAEYFFGVDTLDITGSEVDFRSDTDILADYFGLSPAFSSSVCVQPMTQNVILEPYFYLAKDSWFIRINLPINWVSTTMGLHETIFNPGTDVPFPAEYMTTDSIPAPFQSFIEAMYGCAGYGDVQRLMFGKINGTQRLFGLADVHLVGGWNFLQHQRGHFGLTIHLLIPTSKHSNAEYLFEPMIGNGHHWELGLGFTGHGTIWQRGIDQQCDLVFETAITHLFASEQRRSFDLKSNCFGSRYILAKQFDSEGNYIRKSAPLINATTLCCDISMDLEVDIAFMIAYRHRNLELNLGYDGWVRTHEKVNCARTIPADTFALKGIQNVVEGGLPSNATQSNARLHGNNLDEQVLVADANPPVFISPHDIDFNSGASPLCFTQKIFWYINYLFEESRRWRITPFGGIGADVEFQGYRPKDVDPNKISCAQWGLWLNLGFTC